MAAQLWSKSSALQLSRTLSSYHNPLYNMSSTSLKQIAAVRTPRTKAAADREREQHQQVLAARVRFSQAVARGEDVRFVYGEPLKRYLIAPNPVLSGRQRSGVWTFVNPVTQETETLRYANGDPVTIDTGRRTLGDQMNTLTRYYSLDRKKGQLCRR